MKVLRRVGSGRCGAIWLCLCAKELGGCGREFKAFATQLWNGRVVSCGCRKRDAFDRTKHGGKRKHGATPEYQAWGHMIRRCEKPTAPEYPRYGGRGIRVCDKWRYDFAAFLADMGPRPSSEYSIDRINNNGNYEPGNCRWATRKEQARNTRQTVMLTIDGVTQCMTDWANVSGVGVSTISFRLKKGISPRDAVFAPPGSLNTLTGHP